MTHNRFRRVIILSLISWVATIVTTPANASMIVNIGGTVTGGAVVGGTAYADNQLGVDANPAVGIMDIGAFLNTISVNFVINGFGTTSGSPIGSLSLNTNANLVQAATLPLSVNIIISDTGFSQPATPLTLSQTVNLLSSVGGLTASATAVGYYGDSNLAFDVNGLSTGAASSVLAGGVSVNFPANSGMIDGPSPYSLTTAIHLDLLARGGDPIQNIQLNANLSATTAIPEPGSIMLLGFGLLGLAVFRAKLLRAYES